MKKLLRVSYNNVDGKSTESNYLIDESLNTIEINNRDANKISNMKYERLPCNFIEEEFADFCETIITNPIQEEIFIINEPEEILP